MISPKESLEPALTGMTPEEIAEALHTPVMRGRQFFHWLHKKRVFEHSAMTDLPERLLERAATERPMTALTVVARQHSKKTGTVKLLFQLADGETIESVLLRHDQHVTFCLSSQVGCALGCSFCATGLAGFRRQLTTAEIAEQALHLAREAKMPENFTPNIVYMGMGEPLQNYDAVMQSIRLLMLPEGMGVGARKITVSTVGDAPGILRFAYEPWQVRLSLSMHAADNALRSELVPLNRRYPLETLYDALRRYQRLRRRQITIEWAMLDGVNDSGEQAQKLAQFLKGLDAVVNIIPWNRVRALPYKPASKKRISIFAQTLEQAGIKTTIRKERGDDIDAACGQLRARLIE